MSRPGLCATMALLATSLLVAPAAEAAEIRLREQIVGRHGRVQLGDVAKIAAGDEQAAEDLRRIDLGPAPRRGRPRSIDIRVIRELLALHDFDLNQLQFSGARQVVVYSPHDATETGSQSEPGIPAPDRQSHDSRARAEIVRALRKFLDAKQTAIWEIDAELTRRDIDLFAKGAAVMSVSGGRAPWTGRQQFELLLRTARGESRISVSADVRQPDTVLVASRTLPRGNLISASDVVLQPASGGRKQADALRDLDDVVGMEAARTIAAGQLIESRSIQRPVLVQRGKLVEVAALASGVRVVTEARALDDGARGDLIPMQALNGGDKYTARVVDFNRVEVYAHGPTARPSPKPARAARALPELLQADRKHEPANRLPRGEIRRLIQVP